MQGRRNISRFKKDRYIDIYIIIHIYMLYIHKWAYIKLKTNRQKSRRMDSLHMVISGET